MKKIILVIVLCVLNLMFIMPKSFTVARDHISEAYGIGVIGEAEAIQAVGNIKNMETGILALIYIVLGITMILGFMAIINGKDEEEEEIRTVTGDRKLKEQDIIEIRKSCGEKTSTSTANNTVMDIPEPEPEPDKKE